MTRRLLAAAAALVVALAAPASAAGTGGIEVSPYPGVVDGEQVTAFHVSAPGKAAWALRNTTAETRTGRLYAASASPDGHGGWVIGDAGSSPYLDFPERDVTLAPHQVQVSELRVRGAVERQEHAALVVEVRNGSVVARAATLVYLQPGGGSGLPLLPVGVAVLVLLAAGAAVASSRAAARRRPATPVG